MVAGLVRIQLCDNETWCALGVSSLVLLGFQQCLGFLVRFRHE